MQQGGLRCVRGALLCDYLQSTAGAVSNGTTLEQAQARGLDACAALETFDAYPFFRALGDAVETGPTGNNLRDLRILLAY